MNWPKPFGQAVYRCWSASAPSVAGGNSDLALALVTPRWPAWVVVLFLEDQLRPLITREARQP